MRKAGELIKEYLRESQLATNRAEPIGAGEYGVVYPSDVPGRVMKQQFSRDEGGMLEEANMLAIAAEMGIAPKIHSLEQFPGGIGDRIEMADARDNYEKVIGEGDRFGQPNVGIAIDPRINIKTAQQVGALALKGVELRDRKAGNMLKHKMTGRPLQLDFGVARKVEGDQQVMALTEATADGFEAAGLGDVADIYRATIYDMLEGGDVTDAMDVAKQGFSRLQKIK